MSHTPAVPERTNATPQRRARRPSLSETEFLARALAVFVDKGFEGTSIDSITAEAGIAKRTIYARYGDKETLFKAAMTQGIDEWIVPVERLRAAETDDLEGTLLAVGALLVENILAPAGLRLLRLNNAVSGRMQAIGEHNVRHGQDPTIAYLADLFSRKMPGFAGERVRAEDAAEVFLHLVVGGPANAAAWGVTKSAAAIAERTRLSVRIFLKGMLGLLDDRPAALVRDDKAAAEALGAIEAAAQQLDLARAHLRGTKSAE